MVGERHPREDRVIATPDASSATGFIIAVEANAVHEALSQEEFAKLLRSLVIPNIEMRSAMDVYRHKKDAASFVRGYGNQGV